MTKFYSWARDEYLKDKSCLNGDLVDSVSIYTLTPGATSSFRDLRICADLCSIEEDSSAIKLYKNRQEEEEAA